MKRSNVLTILAAGVILFLVGALSIPVLAAEVPRMPADELKAKLGSPDLVIVDVRVAQDWSASETKIKGAVRVDPDQVNSWIANQPKDKTYVFYCA
jgi:3-mercaptopyruvate sulfurtransferase SseA